ncbi:S24/S26 family peptidase [candidate division KSB1 bacterium]|nr:S24/S26 family peptidase [candidate division KSB1 bacterium]
MLSNIHSGELRLDKDALMTLADAVLLRDVPFRIQAKGGSMSPVIRNGDVITISPLAGCKAVCGDVLAFVNRLNNSLLVHRVIRIKGDDYFFRGDNSSGTVEVAAADQILGRLTGVERNGKAVHFGLGPERILIGFLNRSGGFSLMIKSARKVFQLLQRRIR